MTEQLAEAAERRAGGRGGGADPELLAEPWPRLPGSPFGALCGRVRDPSSGRGNGGAVTVAGPGAGTSATWCRDRASPSRASPSKPERTALHERTEPGTSRSVEASTSRTEQVEQTRRGEHARRAHRARAEQLVERADRTEQAGRARLLPRGRAGWGQCGGQLGHQGAELAEGQALSGEVRRGTLAERRGGSGASPSPGVSGLVRACAGSVAAAGGNGVR